MLILMEFVQIHQNVTAFYQNDQTTHSKKTH